MPARLEAGPLLKIYFLLGPCDLLRGDIQSYMHAKKPVKQRIFGVGTLQLETSCATKNSTDVGPYVLGQAKSMLGRT